MEEPNPPEFFEVYTDGACIGHIGQRNAGCGVYFGENDHRNVSEKIPNNYKQTNQVAELMGIYRALQKIIHCGQNYENWILFSDSKYAILSLTVWIKLWKRNGWKTSKGSPVSNREMINEISILLKSFPNMKFIHVPAHTGILGNEEADRLAKEGLIE